MGRRLRAITALALIGASTVLAVIAAVQNFPRGLSVLPCMLLAAAAGWWALLRRGPARVVGASAAGLLLAGALVGALDAFMKGAERVVDLAEVNARVFVNNVSLGVYAEAVERKSYRDHKLRTLAETVPSVLGPSGVPRAAVHGDQ